MPFSRSFLRRAAGLALVAALALALLPSLARARLPVDLAAGAAAVCRSDDGAPAPQGMDRCGHCLLAAAPWLPTTTQALALPPGSRGTPAPALPPGHPAGAVLAAAHARAPPAA